MDYTSYATNSDTNPTHHQATYSQNTSEFQSLNHHHPDSTLKVKTTLSYSQNLQPTQTVNLSTPIQIIDTYKYSLSPNTVGSTTVSENPYLQAYAKFESSYTPQLGESIDKHGLNYGYLTTNSQPQLLSTSYGPSDHYLPSGEGLSRNSYTFQHNDNPSPLKLIGSPIHSKPRIFSSTESVEKENFRSRRYSNSPELKKTRKVTDSLISSLLKKYGAEDDISKTPPRTTRVSKPKASAASVDYSQLKNNPFSPKNSRSSYLRAPGIFSTGKGSNRVAEIFSREQEVRSNLTTAFDIVASSTQINEKNLNSRYGLIVPEELEAEYYQKKPQLDFHKFYKEIMSFDPKANKTNVTNFREDFETEREIQESFKRTHRLIEENNAELSLIERRRDYDFIEKTLSENDEIKKRARVIPEENLVEQSKDTTGENVKKTHNQGKNKVFQTAYLVPAFVILMILIWFMAVQYEENREEVNQPQPEI